jgi:iron complex transport system ATP-binding protein
MDGVNVLHDMIVVENLGFAYAKRPILKDVGFVAHPGDLIARLGPNGVGKSTLMRCILGFEHSYSGSISIGGQDARRLHARQLAQMVAYIPQSSAQVFDFTLLELVLMGAASRLGLLRLPGRDEEDEALGILEELGIGHLAHQGCGQVSGGEYQLALLARALLQRAKILLMDEPTASLDYGNQYRVMERIAALARRDFVVLYSGHDPNQVLRFANRVLILEQGRLVADGSPDAMMSADALSTLYRIDVRRYHVGEDAMRVPICVPVGRTPGAERGSI